MELELGNIAIRDLKFDDLKAVKEIRDYCLEYLDTQKSYTYEETCKWFTESKPKWYVIELREKVVGYIRTSNYEDSNRSLFVGLDLHPNVRGFGYAFQSYQRFFEWLKLQGYLTIFLRVQISNNAAYKLYRKLGFQPVGIIPNAVIVGDSAVDSVFMYKPL